MRFTGLPELESLYIELEGVGYTPSYSYSDLKSKLQEEHRYIANMRCSISVHYSDIMESEYFVISLYNDYPNLYTSIEFRRTMECLENIISRIRS